MGASGVGVGWPVRTVRDTVCHMKAEVVRRSSHDKIAHSGERRESKPRTIRDQHDTLDQRAPGAGRARDRRDSRWDEHRAARRRQLVDATLAAVGKHGAGVGMEEIAAEAGTSKTVVYRHFADRAELHVAVCNRVASQLLPRLREAIESNAAPRQMVAAGIDPYLAFLEADPELYRFVVPPPQLDGPSRDDPIGSLSDLVGDQA